ncbi:MULTISPECIES: HNH endonuclease [unclassified Mycolicibacterium]|uniref:HNH endonuclease n=1 Tax=unclassified Mycolicibacterium TaxID=2636767 RepID=UPI002ED815C9
MFESMFEVDAEASEAELRAQVETFERLKSAAAAAQARATALWAAKRRAEAAAGVPASRRGRGLASEVALARHDAPVCGGTHLGMAHALVHEMPHTLAALECGALSEWRATLIVRESACLSIEHRRQLDTEMCADPSRLQGWGNARVQAEAKKIAATLDAAAVVDRSAKAAEDRCVTIRPAPDTMAYVTVLLPVQQGVAVYAAAKHAADTTFDERTRGQIMADTVYERVTGRAADQPLPLELNLVMADTTLAGDDDAPAWISDYGPVPAGFARTLITDTATATDEVKATLRRLYRHPRSGQLVAMESQARLFPKGLATLLNLRDQTCRTPYCNAPIRHHDHATPKHQGGPTTALNGLGTCEACNYAKEAPGWSVTTQEIDGVHTAEFVTPTGAVYQSTAPPLPGPPVRTVSIIEGQLSIDVVTFDAA